MDRKSPKIIDADYEVVKRPRVERVGHIAMLIAGLLALGIASYFGMQTESERQAPYLGMAGAGLAAAVRAAFKLFAPSAGK